MWCCLQFCIRWFLIFDLRNRSNVTVCTIEITKCELFEMTFPWQSFEIKPLYKRRKRVYSSTGVRNCFYYLQRAAFHGDITKFLGISMCSRFADVIIQNLFTYNRLVLLYYFIRHSTKILIGDYNYLLWNKCDGIFYAC